MLTITFPYLCGRTRVPCDVTVFIGALNKIKKISVKFAGYRAVNYRNLNPEDQEMIYGIAWREKSEQDYCIIAKANSKMI